MKSRLAEQARQEQLDRLRRMTPEQRHLAFLRHSQLMAQFYLAGQAVAKPPNHDLATLRRLALRFRRGTVKALENLLTEPAS